MSRVEDERWMSKCLALAQRGIGRVSPNPLVGAIVVLDGKVLGKGYHRKFGEPHAEVNAIKNALSHFSNIRGATLYVNLEPCAHYGKTPPCVDAIIKHGITKVVAAIKDPNPQVGGKGFQRLRSSGVKVVTGILKSEASELNVKFLKYITTGFPFVALKVARTSDGFIARKDGSSKWITTKESRKLVHRLRSEYDAVLVGAGTAIADNPELTVRHVKGRNPIRVLIDGKLRTPLTANLCNDKFRRRTIVFTGKSNAEKIRALRQKGVQVILMKEKNGVISIKDILAALAKKGIASVLVEGGQMMYRQFLKERMVDKIHLFTSPKIFGEGISAFNDVKSFFRITQQTLKNIGSDCYVEGCVSY